MTNECLPNLKNVFLFFLLFVSTHSFSQEQEKADISDVTKATFFTPGISYEKRIGKLQSLYAQAFMSTAIYIGYSSALGNTSSIHFYPALTLQYRYYYNSANRKAKGKRTEMNSLNYVSTFVETAFYKETVSSNAEKDLRTLNAVGLAWGFQRNYQKRFSLDLSFGLGYVSTKRTTINDVGQYITKNVGEITNVNHIGLGFWLNKRE